MTNFPKKFCLDFWYRKTLGIIIELYKRALPKKKIFRCQFFFKNSKKSPKINFFRKKKWQILVCLPRAEIQMRTFFFDLTCAKTLFMKKTRLPEKSVKKKYRENIFSHVSFFHFFRKKSEKNHDFFWIFENFKTCWSIELSNFFLQFFHQF